MFIPLEGENILCLANAVALYRADGKTEILRRDGSITETSASPLTLKKRGEALNSESAIKGRSSL